MLYVMLLLFVFALSCSRDSSPIAPAGKKACPMCGLFGGEHEVREDQRSSISSDNGVIVAGDETPSIGPPRTIRIVYFRPNDRPFRQTLVDSIRRVMKQSQSFFAEQMEAYGYGDQTFRLETDEQGEPLVYLFDAKHHEEYYTDIPLDDYWVESDKYGEIAFYLFEMASVFDLDENIYVVVRDFTDRPIDTAYGWRRSKKSGFAIITLWGVRLKTMAHELGHAFGLPHDYRDDSYMLSYGSSRDRISACAAKFLSVHPYFNDAISWENPSPPVVELISPTLPVSPNPFRLYEDSWAQVDYPAGLESTTIKIRVRDSDGIDQILFGAAAGWGYGGLRECRSYNGEKSMVVEYEFDGSSTAADPNGAVTDLSDSPHRINFTVVDTDGSMIEVEFILKLAGTQWPLVAMPDIIY